MGTGVRPVAAATASTLVPRRRCPSRRRRRPAGLRRRALAARPRTWTPGRCPALHKHASATYNPPTMPATPIRAAVCGATGYLGAQCVEILDRHPGFELVGLHGRSSAGKPFAAAVPGSRVALEVEAGLDAGDAQVVFAALPHTVAAAHAREWLAGGRVVVDMSADFRLTDPADYARWYGLEHPAPDLCAQAVYSLVEFHRAAIAAADLLAIPGCYPTASLLATLPALREGLVEPEVVVDAKSGVSGGGRSPSLAFHFSEVNESVSAYGVDGHRHKAEMLQELSAAAGREVRLTFVPHLMPMTRGHPGHRLPPPGRRARGRRRRRADARPLRRQPLPPLRRGAARHQVGDRQQRRRRQRHRPGRGGGGHRRRGQPGQGRRGPGRPGRQPPLRVGGDRRAAARRRRGRDRGGSPRRAPTRSGADSERVAADSGRVAWRRRLRRRSASAPAPPPPASAATATRAATTSRW